MSARTRLLEMHAIGGRAYTTYMITATVTNSSPAKNVTRHRAFSGTSSSHSLMEEMRVLKNKNLWETKIEKNVDTGSHLSKLAIFYMLFLSSYNQQLLLQPHRSGSSDTRAELSINQYPAQKRITQPASLLRQKGVVF